MPHTETQSTWEIRICGIWSWLYCESVESLYVENKTLVRDGHESQKKTQLE